MSLFSGVWLTNTAADIVLYSTGPVKCVDIGWGGYAVFKDKLRYREYKIEYDSSDLAAFDKHIKECHHFSKQIDMRILLSGWLEISKSFQGNYFDVIKSKSIEASDHKKILNSIYDRIPGGLPAEYCNWRYQLLLKNAKECIKAIFDAGLFCSFHYKSLGNGYFSNVSTPNNDYLEAHIVNLFNDYRFSSEQAEELAELLKRIAIPVIR